LTIQKKVVLRNSKLFVVSWTISHQTRTAKASVWVCNQISYTYGTICLSCRI